MLQKETKMNDYGAIGMGDSMKKKMQTYTKKGRKKNGRNEKKKKRKTKNTIGIY